MEDFGSKLSQLPPELIQRIARLATPPGALKTPARGLVRTVSKHGVKTPLTYLSNLARVSKGMRRKVYRSHADHLEASVAAAFEHHRAAEAALLPRWDELRRGSRRCEVSLQCIMTPIQPRDVLLPAKMVRELQDTSWYDGIPPARAPALPWATHRNEFHYAAIAAGDGADRVAFLAKFLGTVIPKTASTNERFYAVAPPNVTLTYSSTLPPIQLAPLCGSVDTGERVILPVVDAGRAYVVDWSAEVQQLREFADKYHTHSCPTCTDKFTTAASLQQHQRTHTAP